MRHFINSGLTSLALVIGLAACAPSKESSQGSTGAETGAVQSAPASAAKTADPALWVVRDDDTTVYLFGTVHVLKPEMKWETERFNRAFSSSDVIYQEADMSDEIQQALGAIVPGLALYSDGRTLRDVLDDAAEKEVSEAAALVGLDMLSVDRMKPWFAAVGLTQMHMVKAGYRPESGVETVITAKAKAANKELRYLETAEMQLRLMAGLPEASQIEFLVAGAEAIEDQPDMLDDLVEDWFEGDVDGIGDLMSDEDAMGDGVVYKALLTDRNRTWTREIRELMNDEAGTFMIAVGAAHLAGEDSVINMLNDMGETVVRQD